jgi:hypothetical protein
VTANEQWELGKRSKSGKPEGRWISWWSTTGHRCCESDYSNNGKVEAFTRYHPDGTWSVKGTTVNGRFQGQLQYQKSKKKTTELCLTEPLYKKVFRVTCECVDGEAHTWRYYSDKGVRIDLDGSRMIRDDEYAKNFHGLTPPADLLALLEFQRLWGIENFAMGFAMGVDDDSLFATWSRDKAFLKALFPVATANGTGSVYALWNNTGKKAPDLAKLPVVIFGDEGGCHVIAENVRGLLAVLGADIEPSVDHDGVSFHSENERSERIKQFRAWLKAEYAIAPAKNPAKLVQRAQNRLGPAFATWVASY